MLYKPWSVAAPLCLCLARRRCGRELRRRCDLRAADFANPLFHIAEAATPVQDPSVYDVDSEVFLVGEATEQLNDLVFLKAFGLWPASPPARPWRVQGGQRSRPGERARPRLLGSGRRQP